MAIRLDNWVSTLKRAAAWNHWSTEDQFLQLVVHLRGRALQEWDLILDGEKSQFQPAIEALKERLEPGGQILAVQDFLHASQRDDEPVSHFVRRLERSFQVAYGRDGLGNKTRYTLLHSQLQEGLRYELMKASSVSGALTYQALVKAAKNEERCIEKLRKRQQYRKAGANQPLTPPQNTGTQLRTSSNRKPSAGEGAERKQSRSIRCYNCGGNGHFASQCRKPKSESQGRPPGKPSSRTTAKQVRAGKDPSTPAHTIEDPWEFQMRVVSIKWSFRMVVVIPSAYPFFCMECRRLDWSIVEQTSL